MSLERVRKYFESIGLADRVMVFDKSSATVKLAAEAVGCEEKQIAKSLSFLLGDGPILIIAAGDVRIDNKKYKATFKQKSKMIPIDLIKDYIGHDIGGVCPFAVKENVKIYLDVSLRENEIVYPAAGSGNSAVKLTIEELEECTNYINWVDVCKK